MAIAAPRPWEAPVTSARSRCWLIGSPVALEEFLAAVALRVRAWVHEPARAHLEIDHRLRQRKRATVAFEHRHFPAELLEPLLENRLEPEERGAAESDHVGDVLLDGSARMVQRGLAAVAVT